MLRTTSHSHQIRQDLQTKLQFDAKRDYFLWAEQKAHQAKFNDPKDKLIWENHAKGLTLREMAPEVGLDYSYLSRKLKKIKGYITEQAEMITSSISYLQAVSR